MYCFRNLSLIVGEALNVAVCSTLLTGQDNDSFDKVMSDPGMLSTYVDIFKGLFVRNKSNKHTVAAPLVGLVPFYMEAHFTLLVFDMRKPRKPMIYELDSMPPIEGQNARKFVMNTIAPLFYKWAKAESTLADARYPISVPIIRRQENFRNACAQYTLCNALTIVLADKIPDFSDPESCKDLFEFTEGPWVELSMRKIFGDIAYEQASTIYGALNCKFLQAALKREKYGEIRPGVYADFVNLDEINLDTEYFTPIISCNLLNSLPMSITETPLFRSESISSLVIVLLGQSRLESLFNTSTSLRFPSLVQKSNQ